VSARKAKPKPEAGPRYSLAEMKRLLEAILFASEKPVPVETLAHMLGNSPEEPVRDALAEMTREYEGSGRSFVLKEMGGGFLLLTHPAYEPWVRKLFRGRLTLRLSKSALETLAIVAYRQPVGKQEIEIIRGVNADAVLNTLLERKLIRVVGRKEGMGRALLYGTTKECLVYLGLNDLGELPQLEEMKAILESQEPSPAVTAEAQGPFTAAETATAAAGAGPAAPEPAAEQSPGTSGEPKTGKEGRKEDNEEPEEEEPEETDGDEDEDEEEDEEEENEDEEGKKETGK